EELAAGVVDEQVDAPVAGEHAVDERVHLLLLADVADRRLAAAAFGQRSGLAHGLLAAAAHDHLRAAGGELERRGAAQAAPPAADDRHLPVEQAGSEHLRAHAAALFGTPSSSRVSAT